MKAVRLQAYGDVGQFRFEDAPDPVPGAGEVLIRVAASGLNPVDLAIRQGFLDKFLPLTFPAIIGRDAAGTIVSVGEGVTGFAPGDRVVAFLPLGSNGAAAGFAVANMSQLAKIPASLSFEDAATLPLASMTGRNAVKALGAKAGDRVLVSGALGSVGRAAIQALGELGAVPVAAVRAERLAEGRALTGEAVDIGQPAVSPDFDFAISTAAPVIANLVSHVKDGGHMSAAVQTPPDTNPGERIQVTQVNSAGDQAQLQAIADAAGRGDLKLPIAKTFPLADLGAAHQALAAGPHGKIVIVH